MKGERRVDNWKDFEELGEGRLRMKVKDENGNVKKEIKHTRVRGKGPMEYVKEKGGKPGWLERKLPDK